MRILSIEWAQAEHGGPPELSAVFPENSPQLIIVAEGSISIGEHVVNKGQAVLLNSQEGAMLAPQSTPSRTIRLRLWRDFEIPFDWARESSEELSAGTQPPRLLSSGESEDVVFDSSGDGG